MNFDFDDAQKELRSEVQRLLNDRASIAEVRKVVDGCQSYQQALWRELGSLGYAGVAIDEAYGGSGLGFLELCIIAEELGRTLAAVPFSSTVYILAEALKEAGTEEQKQKWLPRIAAGETIGCLAYAEGLGDQKLSNIRTSATDGRVHGKKTPVVDGNIATVALVVARDGDDENACSLFVVELEDDVTIRRKPIKSLDPTRGLAAIEFSGAVADRLGDQGQAAALLARIFDRAAILSAFEQVGGAERAVWMARDYALERYAFGRQIGSFQAMQHMMADMYASAELARSNAYYGAWALSTAADELPLAAAYARVSATRSYLLCAKDALHVHGGMGFTWEFDCHLYYRRANFLALQFGGLTHWENLLIRRMRERGALSEPVRENQN